MKFNEALIKLNLAVLEEYPSAQFYEAQGYLIPSENVNYNVDGTIDTAHFKVAYDYFGNGRQKTIIGSFNIKIVDDIWTEDIIMTPYVPITCDQAIKILCEKYGADIVKEGPVTLRHQLFPGESEPRYFFGSIGGVHTVNVYTGKIDVPVGNSFLKHFGRRLGLGIYKLFS